jgi:hypothetical protein
MKPTIVLYTAALAALSTANSLSIRSDDNNNNRGHRHCGANFDLPSDTKSYTGSDIFVLVSKKNPDVQLGATTTPYVTPGDFCTVFHHQIPVSTLNKFCTLGWYLPEVGTSADPFEFYGGGNFQFTGFTYNPNVNASITYNTLPPLGAPIPSQIFKAGNRYIISGGPCGIQPGQTEPSTIGGMLCSSDTTLGFHASTEKCPIGPYILFSDTPGYTEA